ncbi:YlzJ-like family protein [Pseudalkalibacillus berkeleyi]|uniref:YlzJ-like family protein n=1 Tax=Pseudalkalibacillus berkeleyi TaxID=1069813 RepID=A0ABS9GZY7_9BACL|nr:YlzJ-like family protein [Pseudalkalibacillus berkeleyi]MCF6137165.1 YlzJ-like family protein [Pseudalkalibacillus berkeleyi]
MILYTTVPHEIIFSAVQTDFEKYSMINMNGIPLMVERLENQDCRIVQMMSTDPAHFLDDQLQPGTVLKMTMIPEENTF